MKLRIALLAVNIVILYWVVGVYATNVVWAQNGGACADISGQWDATETVTATCSEAGETYTINETGSGKLTINQTGCNISWIIPGFNISRSGTVGQSLLNVSGPFVVIDDPSVVVFENIVNITGTIHGETLIRLTGEGYATGTVDGIPASCTGTSQATFTREPVKRPDLIVTSVTVSNSTPRTGQSFTVSATVRNQGAASSNSTTLHYYRSTSSTIATGDIQLSSDDVAGLSPGGSSPESQSVSIDETGTYWIGACVDPVSGESLTTNNCSTGIQVTVMEQNSIIPIIELLLGSDE